MNDFTKEELEILFHWGLERAEAIGLKNFQDEGHDELCVKLRCMIRDYCAHDSKQYYDDVPVNECNNCHMVML